MKMKMIFSLLLSSALWCTTAYSVQAANSQTSYEWEYQESGYSITTSGKTIVRGGVTYVEFGYLARQSGLNYTIDKAGKRAAFNGWTKKIAVREGSKTAILDNQAVTLQGAPFFHKEKGLDDLQIYVPFKFAVQALEGTFKDYDPKTRTVKASNVHSYSVVTEVYQGTTYTLTKNKGDLFAASGNSAPVKLTSLHSDLDWAGMKISRTSGGLLFITINDSQGEPHIYNQQFQLLFKNGALIRQSAADFGWGAPDLVDRYDDYILMNDGKILRVIEDGSGTVVDSITDHAGE